MKAPQKMVGQTAWERRDLHSFRALRCKQCEAFRDSLTLKSMGNFGTLPNNQNSEMPYIQHIHSAR
jgi:hypothetical protein